MLGGDQGAGADLEVTQAALLEQLVQHGHTHPQLGRGSTDRVHRASPGPVAIHGGGSGSVRQGLRVLSDLMVQPFQLGEPLLQMRQ